MWQSGKRLKRRQSKLNYSKHLQDLLGGEDASKPLYGRVD